MKIGRNLIRVAIDRPWLVVAAMLIVTVVLGAMMIKVQVDTDPENMLAENEAVRVFHHEVKKTFALHDVVVLGIVNDKHPDGVFNPRTLAKVHALTQFAQQLADAEDPGRRVVAQDIVAPGTVDAIEQAGPGQVRFEWLMPKPPATREDALKVRDRALANPLLKGTLVSENGKALALYLPITSKDFAYQVRERLLARIETLDAGDDQFYITGLPVAEDTFGVEMFVQMAVSAPLAMMFIFLLMLLFFKNVRLIISPMIIAMVAVISTMGLLIGTGNTVHIMSSMIPIFLMPIAVVDSIHILSEFFDRYQQNRNRRKTLEQVMGHLFMPMLYTSLTSSAGFASLALTPIPPVRVFGLFVAFGIMLAWLLTIVFIPAYVMLLREETLTDLGKQTTARAQSKKPSLLARHLAWMGGFTLYRAKAVLAVSLILLVAAGYGISRIAINDNPVKWFQKKHAIRVADRVLNDHFGGTYEAYLVLSGETETLDAAQTVRLVKAELAAVIGPDAPQAGAVMAALIDTTAAKHATGEAFIAALAAQWEIRMDNAPDDDYEVWADGLDAIDKIKRRDQVFKRPDVLNYVAALQAHLIKTGVAGKSNSVADVVKKVYMELLEGQPAYFRIPDTVNGVAQSLISFQNSHKPDDLWHLVTPDYTRANVWVQLKNGDNKDMEATVAAVDRFMAANPPPVTLRHQWAGLTYLNVVWQDKMVTGMLKSFLSSFGVVFLMMAVLFRSPLWGGLAMVPLTVTIALIYGLIGIIGKDYDMPVAVLSSLTLGLAVDFAIHFLERSRSVFRQTGSWSRAAGLMFAEPARAISRNVIVIAVGFTPLLLAPLVPYQTVGVFLAAIMAISGFGTLYLLPSLITLLQKFLFGKVAVARAQTPSAQKSNA